MDTTPSQIPLVYGNMKQGLQYSTYVQIILVSSTGLRRMLTIYVMLLDQTSDLQQIGTVKIIMGCHLTGTIPQSMQIYPYPSMFLQSLRNFYMSQQYLFNILLINILQYNMANSNKQLFKIYLNYYRKMKLKEFKRLQEVFYTMPELQTIPFYN